MYICTVRVFLYSQDLSNRKTLMSDYGKSELFLYSQDLSNRKTVSQQIHQMVKFLYSQDLSNRKTEVDFEQFL